MNESIFSRLFRYKQTEKMSPKENYLTEMLAWMIDSLPQFGHDYVLFLNSKCKEKLNFDANCPFTVSAETQFRVKKGIIDMVIETDCGYGFICEHKVDSSLRENQIKDYSECDKEINKDITFKTVLLTKSKDQHEQNPDIQIIWHDVYEFFSDPIRKESYNADEKIIIEQFLKYLTEVGMAIVPCRVWNAEQRILNSRCYGHEGSYRKRLVIIRTNEVKSTKYLRIFGGLRFVCVPINIGTENRDLPRSKHFKIVDLAGFDLALREHINTCGFVVYLDVTGWLDHLVEMMPTGFNSTPRISK